MCVLLKWLSWLLFMITFHWSQLFIKFIYFSFRKLNCSKTQNFLIAMFCFFFIPAHIYLFQWRSSSSNVMFFLFLNFLFFCAVLLWETATSLKPTLHTISSSLVCHHLIWISPKALPKSGRSLYGRKTIFSALVFGILFCSLLSRWTLFYSLSVSAVSFSNMVSFSYISISTVSGKHLVWRHILHRTTLSPRN